jgi:hypothetical protein
MYTSAKPPLVIHIFCPFRIHELPSGDSTARVREFCASEPACGSDRQYAASFSPVARSGNIFSFAHRVPKKTMGSVPMPECAPWLTPNEAFADNFSASCTLDTLSSPAPPYSSGTPPPSRAYFAGFLEQLREQAFLVHFEVGNQGNHFVADKLFGRLANQFLIVRQFSG